MNDNLKYKTVIKRLAAAIIDAVLLIPIGIADYYFRSSVESKPLLFSWITLVSLSTVFYSVFLHYKYGQTFGKMYVDIKVVNLNESTGITFKQALLRDSFYVIVEVIALLYFAMQLATSSQATEVLLDEFDTFGGGTVVFLWTLLEFFTMLFNSKRRAFHDLIAGTVVIRTNTNQLTVASQATTDNR